LFFTGRQHAGENLADVHRSRCVTRSRATCPSCRRSWKSS
jgi:hypothetical protein